MQHSQMVQHGNHFENLVAVLLCPKMNPNIHLGNFLLNLAHFFLKEAAFHLVQGFDLRGIPLDDDGQFINWAGVAVIVEQPVAVLWDMESDIIAVFAVDI